MVVTLGKRKRQTEAAKEVVPAPGSDSEDDAKARALFQKAFEAKFKPLDVQPVRAAESSEDDIEDEDADGDEESDWSGVSGGEDEVEIIEHAQPDIDAIFGGLKHGKKSYMSSKPPTAEEQLKLSKAAKSTNTEDEGSEVANLKKDVALQRLLKESHLLDASSFRSQTGPQGKDRLKALDLRLQDLGAKTSAIQQEKMPMSMRKGILSKAADREAARRKEAAENGIILEKFKHQAKSQKHRVRGVTGHGIGKMQGSTLKLSARDVRSIQGPPGGAGRKGRRK